MMKLKVYLSGEIHSDWRETIAEGIKAAAITKPVMIAAK